MDTEFGGVLEWTNEQLLIEMLGTSELSEHH